MSNDIRDWLSFAIGLVSLFATLYFGLRDGSSRLVSRDFETTLKGFGIEVRRSRRERYRS